MLLQETKPIVAYAAKTRDDDVLMSSSSGGVFTELASVTLSRGGVVFGAGWDNEFNVVHKCVENQADLGELRGSKYVRSDMKDTVRRITELLSEQRDVLFTGTPCQCAAVRKVCEEDPNLLICGIMCHSTVNPKVWRKYLEEFQHGRNDSIVAINFRNKSLGWQHGAFKVDFKDGSSFVEPLVNNTYAKIFFSGVAAQKACLNCQFRRGAHGADVLIGDFWGVEKTHPDLFDRNGVSSVVAYTQRGKKAIEQTTLSLTEVPYSDILQYNPYLEKSIRCESVKRMRFEKVWRRVNLRRAYAYASGGPWCCRLRDFSYNKMCAVVSRVLKILGLRK